ncbi:unnamed protein product [Miscanthus lutarioriparius]|uniref:Uncharacterized protein n=1 Tax=Miscanthus lutarioriparius TaxID=422564 RepID=A0A811RQN9_9POAL|nr:unnamed protein product [Miscanthus lutarioriparius]
MASTSASPPPFTFASPVSFSSETHEDALDFDYESWIQQSKLANCYSNKRLWMDDAEAEVINRYHQEMMLRVADNLPEEAYELSLRDITELSLPPPPPPPRATPTRSLPCRHKSTPSISMEGAGSFITKLFMPSPSRAAASSSFGGGRRNKSFSSSSMTVSVLRKKRAPANHGHSRSVENDTHSNGYHDSTKR